MPRLRLFLAAIGLAILTAPAGAAPLSAYGKLPTIEDVSLSASGAKLALIVTDGEERKIVVKDVAGMKTTFAATLGRAKVRDIRFAGDQHVIITSSATASPLEVQADRSEWFFASDLNLETRHLQALLTDAGESMNAVLGYPTVREIGGEPVVFLEGYHFVNSRGVYSLFRIDLKTEASHLVEAGLVHSGGFVIGADGQPVAQSLFDRDTGDWTLKVRRGVTWETAAARNDPLDPPWLMGLARDGRSVLVHWDHSTWRDVSPDGVISAPADAPEDRGVIHDPVDGRLIGEVETTGDRINYDFFADRDQRAWKAVQGAYPGCVVRLVSWSDDRRVVVVRVDSPENGPAYAIVDLRTPRATWIGGEYGDLAPQDIGPRTLIHFKASDGLELSGYLTLPKGRSAKGLPLIVFPHGGPASDDSPGFDWWAEAMASRGYAVLQVNFRGSGGLGWDLTKAGFGEWGRKMQTDLSDGVGYLASQGTIDPKRVCIVGGSYGGYAALAGVTVQKGVYRCAVSVAGVSDLRVQFTYSHIREGNTALRYWDRYLGAKDYGDALFATYSPALRAADASAPILLIHGKDDTVVPLKESLEMADALHRAGKPVELIVQDGADHWLSLGATRLQMLEATMAFVEKNNPPT